MENKEFHARRAELKNSIKAKYASELSSAGIFRRLIIRHRIHRELRRAWKKIMPSFQSLY